MERGYFLSKRTDNKFYFQMSPGGSYTRNDLTTYSDVAYTDNAWHHLVGTILADGTHYIYVDGVQQTAHSGTGTFGPDIINMPFTIGTGYGDYANYTNYYESFTGYIDDVRLYNRTLSSAEIKALYNSKVNKFNTSAMILTDGQYNYTVYAVDAAGNANSSGWRYFTVSSDATAPTITFELPTPSNTSSTTSPVTIVANISDASNTSSFIDLDRSLLLWLSMERNALDNSSYNWSTTNGGATFIDGKFGQALRGFTSSAHVDVNSSLDYAAGNITISFWMYVNNTATPNRQNPIDKAFGGDGTFTLEPDGTINFYFGSAGGDAEPYTSDSSGTSAANGTWQHWVLTRDRTSRTTQWYLNGTVSGSAYVYTVTHDPYTAQMLCKLDMVIQEMH